MSQTWIQLPSDSSNTGKQLQTYTNTIGGSSVYAEGVVIVDDTGTEKATSGNPLRIDPVGTTVQPVSAVPETTGGLTPSYNNTTGGSATISVKGSAGQVYGWFLDNSANTTPSCISFYNATTATQGTTSPTFVLVVPAGLGANVFTDIGVAFGTGIRIGVSTTYNGSTAVANAMNITVFYN